MTWVIKLGGSLADDPLLKSWLDMLAEHGRGKVVIVPGGGPYADAVRAAQHRWKFADAIAHRMALLAMEQFALQMQAITPALVVADSTAAILGALETGKVPLWLPGAMALSAPQIPQTWDISSDSLAAWLAKTIHAAWLILVKSCELNVGEHASDLARRGVIDAGFEDMVRNAEFAINVVTKSDLEWVQLKLRGDDNNSNH